MEQYQIDFVNKIKNTVAASGLNAYMSSATGTGKTLSLLSAVSHWLINYRVTKKIQLIYCSRTHSQLENVVKEFRKLSDYEKELTILTLGSVKAMGGHCTDC